MTETNTIHKTNNSDRQHDGRKIFLGILMILIWAIAYGAVVLGNTLFQATVLSLNTISNLISDTLIIIGIGLVLVFFFILSDFFIRLSVDRRAFVKLEQCYLDYKSDRMLGKFLSDFIHFDQIETDENPIPKSENFALIFLGVYYILNFIGFSVITEILFFTISAAGTDTLLNNPNSQLISYILPILASCLVIGGKVASLYYKYYKEYAQMLTETLFIFLLFGILSSLYGQELPSFQEIIPGENVVPVYISILAYLSLVPVGIEIIKWLLWMKKEESLKKQKQQKKASEISNQMQNSTNLD